jgi:FkbH-like protein
MKKIQEVASQLNQGSIAEYLNLYKILEAELQKGSFSFEKSIKIALLSSFTCRGLKEILAVKCSQAGIKADIYVGEYNQYRQEIWDEQSQLYQFHPDVLIFFIDLRSMLGESFFMPYQQTAEQRRLWVENTAHEILDLVATFKSRSPALVLLHNFEVPSYSPLGIQEAKQPYGFIESIQDLNHKLRETCKLDPQTYLFNYDAFCAFIGKSQVFNDKMYYLGDIKLNLNCFPDLCSAYMAYIKARLGMTKKCLVLDLDQTLWGGIIGEDGLEGIKLGPTPEGRPYWEFQKMLLALYQRGIILAVNSKNNPDDALKVLREHPHMILREEHFASLQINWDDKITNMKHIAEDLNIGLDSLVFIDDDPHNREMVAKALPEVYVVHIPQDPAGFAEALQNIDDFNSLQFTHEDAQRGRMYAARRQMEQVRKTTGNITDYLKELQMVVKIAKANAFSLPRLAQLVQKTNQFNMTTRRYSEEDIKGFAKNDAFMVLSVAVADKFGDQGLVGIVILEKSMDSWRLDTFLLSCRVIGRQVEEAILAYILKLMRADHAPKLIGEFIPTKKNIPAQDFYQKHGFAMEKTVGDVQYWIYPVERLLESPDYINVVTEYV